MINDRIKSLKNKPILDKDNQFKQFIDERLIYTQDKFDSCTVNDLKASLKEFGLGNLLKSQRWVVEVSNLLRLSGLTVIERIDWSRKGKTDRRRNKILNIKLKQP